MEAGDIVRAAAGKDKGRYFLLIACGNGYGMIVNGRRRKIRSPKKKSLAHLEKIATGRLPHPLTNKVVLKLLRPYTSQQFKEES